MVHYQKNIYICCVSCKMVDNQIFLFYRCIMKNKTHIDRFDDWFLIYLYKFSKRKEHE